MKAAFFSRETLYWVLLVTLTALSMAQQGYSQSYRISSGTGFFVSRNGHIITNEHVVRGCDTVAIRGGVQQTEAQVIAVDEEADLALLQTSAMPSRIASLRFYGDEVGPGDGVMVMGYPENHGITGEYKVETSEIVDVAGPLGEAKWIQFEDSARQGNSGGPLLDLSGNVVGVVVGKSTLMQVNALNGREEVVRKSDIAISLPYLTDFLDRNHVLYYKLYSAVQNSIPYIEQSAKDYIVNIHCRL